MPTRREREYYQLGFQDGVKWLQATGAVVKPEAMPFIGSIEGRGQRTVEPFYPPKRTKRKLSAWNKYIKNKRNHIKYRDGKLNLKKMAVAFRRKKRR